MSWLARRRQPPKRDPGLDQFRDAIGALRKDGAVAGYLVTGVEAFWGCGDLFRTQERLWIQPFWLGEHVPHPEWSPLEHRREAVEDYPPWRFRGDLERGMFDDGDDDWYEVEWLTGPARDDAKRILGMTRDDI